ncbi:MAG: DNA polymerase III subunit alpha [Bacteroidales bacterium]|nr:DNA polymerase III subunit alpha [Bacteroidales bacterium]
MVNFTHLHVHSHYSVLDGMSKVPDLVNKAMKTGMYALALTDHGNMYGIKDFVDTVKGVNGKTKDKIKEQEKILAKEDATEEEKANATQKIEELKKQIFKPIIGIEAYCARRGLKLKDKDYREASPETGKMKIVDNSGYHLILLAKNKKGYQNLCKLSSIAFIDGYYGSARIDKEVLEKYHEGIIASSACLGGEIPQLIIANKLDKAEESVLWFKRVFGDDFYIELQRHKTDKPGGARDTYEKQCAVNKVLVELARKHDIKIIATNDVHFVEEEHGEAHERLICLSTQTELNAPNRGMAYTKQEWLKSPEEMEAIFSDLPEALENTMEIADKVEVYDIDSGPIMPAFPIPEDFGTEEEYRQKFTHEDLFNEFTQDENGNVVMSQEEAEKKIKKIGGYEKLYRIKLEADYLAKLAWDGAHKRYGENLTQEQTDRIKFELHIMKTMGFPGYFLIVQDYIRGAREELGVWVGPGRGSAAGSVVAYCLWITDLDPLKYDLLFERFLNPDRISLPDIDVDFDDAGRGKVLDWVTHKYGAEKVAHIITYGTMATKSAIADVGRVQGVPLERVNEIKKLIPDKFDDKIKDEKGKNPKVNLKNCIKYVPEIKQIVEGDDRNAATMIEYAEELEGTIRQVGIHACGFIIGADDLSKFAPISTIEDKETEGRVPVTQYDGHVIESVGLIKMDFLGLITLSIMKEAVANIKKSKGIDLDINSIPIDDKETYKIYCAGKTIGIFQFESPGMQKYLRELQPSVIEDLIAMNALYRPGPIAYIPQFIARKHGKEPITYDIPIMEKYLKDTYGITVYQEQVMLLSRLLADFTRGESDALRKAMGKKKKDIVDAMKPKFIEGGKKNGHDPKVLEKIWGDWESFASYAFNKSHAACYAWVSYQTAYLKAHYPAEFMAANLTLNKDDITEVTKLMSECKSMKINVLLPDVNESDLNFTVTKSGDIRFGLGGVKGVGEGAVMSIISEREANGPYKDIFDFVSRVNLQSVNKKTIEALAFGGAFDSFNTPTNPNSTSRDQIVSDFGEKGESSLDMLIKFGRSVQQQKNDNTMSLFGATTSFSIALPKLPPRIDKMMYMPILLKNEYSVLGIYLSSHPLDKFKFFIDNSNIAHLDIAAKVIEEKNTKTKFTVVGYITKSTERTSKNGNFFGEYTIIDYYGELKFALFGKDYTAYKANLVEGHSIIMDVEIKERNFFNNDKKKDDKNREIILSAVYSNIRPLQDVDVKSINMYFDTDGIDSNFRKEFYNVIEKCKGKTELCITLVSGSATNKGIKMVSRTKLIDVNNDEINQFIKNNPSVIKKVSITQ